MELLTDIYLGADLRPRPAILVRTPYGRGDRGAADPLGLGARLFAERGYHVVVQSVRGTFGSGGELDARAEPADGRATADWIVRQRWSNGEIGTFGPSYLSLTQYALASTRPPQLKAMAISIMTADRRRSQYPGGAFALDSSLTWARLITLQESARAPWAVLQESLRQSPQLLRAFGHLPLREADVAATGRVVPFYREWLEHEDLEDPYWQPTNFGPALHGLGVPVSLVGGWHDYYVPYLLDDYRTLRAAGEEVALRVGGWRHTSPGVMFAGFREALRWFDLHLRHQPAGAARVRLEVTGGGGWREFDDWPPPAAEQRWHLQPGGRLASEAPPASEPDRYRYDPADPTPQVGGYSLSVNSGPKDNRALERRPDVLTYTSERLAADLEAIGVPAVELYVESSLEHTDFFARLCDVEPGGRSLNVSDALVRLGPGDSRRLRLELFPVAHLFRAGHRLRLQVSSGSHPRYSRNLGSGEPLATGTTLRAAEQAVFHDPARPSALLLPGMSGGRTR